jgi:hypothetical protein
VAEVSKPVRAPIVLDPEDDSLYAQVPPTPTDDRFRRGLYVFLVVLGLIAAASFVESRQANDEAAAARLSAMAAEGQRDELQRQLNQIIAGEERDARRDRALERLLVGLLSRSEDPVVRDTFRELAAELGIDPGDISTILPPEDGSGFESDDDGSGADSGGSAPTPGQGGEDDTAPSSSLSPSPSPSSSPQPSPSPSPSPSRSPIVDLPDPLPDIPNPLPYVPSPLPIAVRACS